MTQQGGKGRVREKERGCPSEGAKGRGEDREKAWGR